MSDQIRQILKRHEDLIIKLSLSSNVSTTNRLLSSNEASSSQSPIFHSPNINQIGGSPYSVNSLSDASQPIYDNSYSSIPPQSLPLTSQPRSRFEGKTYSSRLWYMSKEYWRMLTKF
jgi:hypothetical protein